MTSKRLQILERAGKAAFAVLPIEDYRALQQRLEDLALLRDAERASGEAPGRPLDDVLRELGLEPAPAKGRRHRGGSAVQRRPRRAS